MEKILIVILEACDFKLCEVHNVVYNELISRDYEVYIGKTKNGEVDFIAKKDGNTKYI